jgi:hypothetical protein
MRASAMLVELSLHEGVELFRHACEVRYVATRFNAMQREEHFKGVAQHRGDIAAQRLRKDVDAELERRVTGRA